jgi:hypothetical protein
MKEKKLTLKKEVISVLSTEEKKNILGGNEPIKTWGFNCITGPDYTCPLTLTCVPPYSDC